MSGQRGARGARRRRGLTDERVGRVGVERGLPGAVPRLALLHGGGDPGGLARLGGGGGRDVDREPGAIDERERAEASGGLNGGEALREVDEGRDIGEAAIAKVARRMLGR